MAEANAAGSESDVLNFKNLILVSLLFFLSGATSLIYQVIWTREMVFVFGSTTFASATVLSAFMGGLAIGSYTAGRFADKLRNPFLIYGILEGIIGLWALAAPFMFNAVLPIYKSFWLQFHLSVLPFSLLRFVIVSMILLIPTACMGATLPLLSRFVTNSLSVVGSRVGTLYSINTLGAVVGAISGGFLLIPSIGLNATTMTAAAANVLLAIIVFVLQKTGLARQADALTQSKEQAQPQAQAERPRKKKRKEKKKDAEAEQESADSETALAAENPALISRSAISTMIGFGISGAIAMVYEIAWTRSLLLIIGSTTYAFSIMLSTFLLGIFLGSLIAARLVDRLKEPVLCFAVLQVVLGAAALFSIILFDYLPYLNLVANSFDVHDANVGMIVRFLLAACVLVPITLLLGASFPVAVKACTPELEKIGRSIGTLYSINTLGAILGSFAAGFLIIPLLGSQQALVVSATANIILGAVLLFAAGNTRLPFAFTSAALALALSIWAFQSPQLWDLHALTASQKIRRGLNFNRPGPILPYDKWKALVDKSFNILFRKDGLCANVAVVEFPDHQKSLFTNGHIDASDGETDMATQVLLPCIPLLLRPQASDVADVGWGSGCTMGYALRFPIKRMVCAEIEPAVIETSQFFHKVNLAPETDNRLSIEINDGRNFLLATDEKFDVITSEPSNPWQAGVCNLYTKEYFQICHDRLKPGGIFTMWWQYNEVPNTDLVRVFAALKSVYKHLLVFQTYSGDIAACASDSSLQINLKEVQKSLDQMHGRQALSSFGKLEYPEDLALKVVITDQAAERMIKGVEPNSDDRNFIEFDVSKHYEQENYSANNIIWLSRNGGAPWEAIDWTGYSEEDKAKRLAGMAERAMVTGNPAAAAWAVQSLNTKSNSFAMCVIALLSAQRLADFNQAFSFADKAVKQFPGEIKSLMVRGIVELLGGAPLKARKDFTAALKMDPNNVAYRYRLAETYLPEMREWYQIAAVPMDDDGKADSDPAKVLELASPLASNERLVAQNPQVLAFLGAASLKMGKVEDAIRLLNLYLRTRPEDVTALRLIAEAYSKNSDSQGARFAGEKAEKLAKIQAGSLCTSAERVWKEGKEKLAISALKRALDFCPDSQDARKLLRQIALQSESAKSLMKELSTRSFEDMQAYRELNRKLENEPVRK